MATELVRAKADVEDRLPSVWLRCRSEAFALASARYWKRKLSEKR